MSNKMLLLTHELQVLLLYFCGCPAILISVTLLGIQAGWCYWLLFSLGSLWNFFRCYDSSHGGDLKVRYNSDLLSPVSEVHDVFTERALPSISGKQPWAISIAYIVLGSSLNPLNDNSKEGFSFLEVWLLLNKVWLSGGALWPQVA